VLDELDPTEEPEVDVESLLLVDPGGAGPALAQPAVALAGPSAAPPTRR